MRISPERDLQEAPTISYTVILNLPIRLSMLRGVVSSSAAWLQCPTDLAERAPDELDSALSRPLWDNSASSVVDQSSGQLRCLLLEYCAKQPRYRGSLEHREVQDCCRVQVRA